MKDLGYFTVLLGQNLTSRARSPKLWSAAFEAHCLSVEMKHLSVDASQLSLELESLSADDRFIGGAVAAPHKRLVSLILGSSVDEDVKLHGCVNCIYRGKDKTLRGANTDGIGAMRAIREHWGTPVNWTSIVVGLGGVGRPIARELSLAVGDDNLIVVSRRPEDRRFAKSIGAKWAPWNARRQVVGRANLIVNCTPLGAGDARGSSPLSYEELNGAPAEARVFDVIYDPSPSRLLVMAAECGLSVLDGKSMNLFQAELAFAKCFPERDRSITSKAMAAAFAAIQ